MIIVSQDKSVIVNFDNIVYIDIDDDNIIVAETDGDCVNLGQYKTEERAKEVLDEIAKFYHRDDYKESLEPIIGIGEIISRDKAAFYMPLE